MCWKVCGWNGLQAHEVHVEFALSDNDPLVPPPSPRPTAANYNHLTPSVCVGRFQGEWERSDEHELCA